MRPLILSVLLVYTGAAALSPQTASPGHVHSDEAIGPSADDTSSHSSHKMSSMNVQYNGGHARPDRDEAEFVPYEPMSLSAGSFGMLLFDQLEYRSLSGNDLLRWDIEGWYGGDSNRFWFKTEGEGTVQGERSGDAEVHGYFGRLIAPFWDAQVGVRYDRQWEPGNSASRFFAAIGVEGLAPYKYEITPTLFVSDDADVSMRLTATRDLRISQRLVAQARFETEVAFQDVPEFGVGSSFNYVELGLRLRYEVRREIAPYIGIEWARKLGETSDLANIAGEDSDVVSFLAGIRAWF